MINAPTKTSKVPISHLFRGLPLEASIRIRECPFPKRVVSRFPVSEGYSSEKSQEPYKLTDGHSGSIVTNGTVTSYPNTLTAEEKSLEDVLGVRWLPCHIDNSDGVQKRNVELRLDELEAKVTNFLAQYPECNVLPVHLDGKGNLESIALRTPSLQDISYYFRFLNPDKEYDPRIMDIYGALINEAVNISALLESDKSPFTQEDLDFIKKRPYKKAAKAFNISEEEARNSFYLHRLSDKLGIDFSELQSTLQGMQDFVNQYNPTASIISTDRAPSNRREKNVDFNKIEEAPFTREVAYIADTVPGSFTLENRVKILRRAVDLWNKKSDRKIPINDNLLNSYLCESFYISLMLAARCFDEAREIYKREEVGGEYFEYPKLFNDGRYHLMNVWEVIPELQRAGLLNQEQTEKLSGLIQDSISRKTRDILGEDKEAGMKEVLTDDFWFDYLIKPYAIKVVESTSLL